MSLTDWLKWSTLLYQKNYKEFPVAHLSVLVEHHISGIITLPCSPKDNSFHNFTNPLNTGFSIIFVYYFECGCGWVCLPLCLYREGSFDDFLLEQYQAEVWDDFRFSLLSVSMLCLPAQPASDYQDLVVMSRECNKEGGRDLRERESEQRKGSSPGCGNNSAQHICGDDSLGTSCGFLELIE